MICPIRANLSNPNVYSNLAVSREFRHVECQFTPRKCEAALLVIASANLRVLVKQSMVRPIVGEHWRVFDTTAGTAEESGMGSRAAFPRYREKKGEKRKGAKKKIYSPNALRGTMLQLPARRRETGWEIYENI